MMWVARHMQRSCLGLGLVILSGMAGCTKQDSMPGVEVSIVSPSGSHAPTNLSVLEGSCIQITVGHGPTLLVQSDEADLVTIPAILRTKPQREVGGIIVNADRSLKSSQVVEVLDKIAESGVSDQVYFLARRTDGTKACYPYSLPLLDEDRKFSWYRVVPRAPNPDLTGQTRQIITNTAFPGLALLTVEIREHSFYTLEKELQDEDLAMLLRDSMTEHTTLTVGCYASERATYQRLIDFFDICTQAGLRNYVIFRN